MRRTLSRALMLVSMVAAPPSLPAHADTPPSGTADMLAPLLPAVVNIKTVTMKNGGHYYYWGSGFFIEASGVIVTNRHVILGADKITVTARGIEPQLAKVLYVSDLLDLAVLKIDVGKPLPVLHFGDSDTVRIGDPVLAIGNPLGIGESVSAGVVSALNRNIRETIYDNFIQTDAAINHGNSGGPMLNTRGEVVAIDTALYSSPHNTGSIGVGFALPANDAKFIVDQVVRIGHVQAGWIGVHLQRISPELAQGFGITPPRGVLVAAVAPHSPAAGDLHDGDVLLQIAGHPVTDVRGVDLTIAEAPVGQPIMLTVLRDGVELRIPITVADTPPPAKGSGKPAAESLDNGVAMATPTAPGMRLAAITPANRREYDLGSAIEGVVVTEVMPRSAAAERGIVAGDVILQVRQDSVRTPAEVERALRALASGGIDEAPLLVTGKKEPRWLALPLEAAR